MGKSWAGRIMKLLADAEVVALADVVANELEGSGHGVRISAHLCRLREMLGKEKLDAVAVATPDNFHRGARSWPP